MNAIIHIKLSFWAGFNGVAGRSLPLWLYVFKYGTRLILPAISRTTVQAEIYRAG